jgi:CubicO group peptidase (beta-lactamase class C family)
MSAQALSHHVEANARELGIPGVSVGVWFDGREILACYGVTSVENPLPVEPDTLFLLGSVTKTFTATLLMRLVADGLVELDAPLARYVPEFSPASELDGGRITVLNLLNHTAGLDSAIIVDTGEGDDAIANYVRHFSRVALIAEPSARASYSQAGYILAGRIAEKVTGITFEKALASLVFEPIGLSSSFFDRDDIMTRRFAVGHNRADDGTLRVARLWRRARGDNPGGGLVSTISDLLRWARFHLGNGRSESGARVLPGEALKSMQRKTVALRGSSLGDALGIGWFLGGVEGVRSVGHGGSANGQFAEFLLVPERNFAVAALSNAGPDGISFNRAAVCWTLEHFLGLVDRDPEPAPFDESMARQIAGEYENEAMTLSIRVDETGLKLEVRIRPEIRAAADKELPPDYPPMDFGMLSGEADEFIITTGGLKGQRGFFTRDGSGTVVGADLAGRLFSRASSRPTGRQHQTRPDWKTQAW